MFSTGVNKENRQSEDCRSFVLLQSIKVTIYCASFRAKVTASLLDALYRMDQQLLVDRSGILDAYRSACVTLGKEVSVVKADGTVRHGTALDIDEYGALRVHFPDTGTETVNSGEVSVRGMYGYL